MSDTPYRRWLCDACGYIYDEAKGDPDSGLSPGTRYQDIPEDWQCPLCGLRKADLRLMPEAPAFGAGTPAAKRGPSAGGRGAGGKGSPEHLVIVGAGVAGWSVAESVRRRDPARPILLVTACEGLVYAKPALSMAMAQGKSADDLVDDDAATRAATLGIEVLTRTRVIKIDPGKRRVVTAKGGIAYGDLVLALGARQRELDVRGDAADQVLRVNDIAAYRTLRERLAGARHVTILGGGLIGCEFADDLRSGGLAVTVVEPAARPLAALLPQPMSEALHGRLAARGVDWRLGLTLDRLDSGPSGLEARLSDGSRITTDLVLSAAGLLPITEPAAKAGLAIDGGILVDRAMRTSAPGIYALGDCAAVEGRVFSYIEPIRRQAEAIAADLAGGDEAFVPLPPLVRVKTPSLPLTVCAAGRGDSAQWTLVESDDEGLRMEYQGNDGPGGFALAGRHAQFGMALYRGLAG
jgi:rubredoxin-NAD+ reductase